LGCSNAIDRNDATSASQHRNLWSKRHLKTRVTEDEERHGEHLSVDELRIGTVPHRRRVKARAEQWPFWRGGVSGACDLHEAMSSAVNNPSEARPRGNE
jgi:hypothetical protein